MNPGKIVLGLMPGKDDMGRDLTLQDALNLTTYGMQNNLVGIMTWDANNDSVGLDGNAPYAFSLGIESMLGKRKRNMRKYLKKRGINKII